MKQPNWKKLAKSLAMGIVFAFVIYILSGSNASLGMGMLLAYFHYYKD